MKKVILMIVVVAIVACSSSPYGLGGDHAAQYVREQVPEMIANAASVNPTGIDSTMVYDVVRLSQELDDKNTDVELGIATENELTEFADSIGRLGEVRIVYIVTITAKSSHKKEMKVVMEKDGVTPYMLYDEYEKLHLQFIRKVAEFEIPVVDIDDIEDI